jgi:shikimate dehydrogenase
MPDRYALVGSPIDRSPSPAMQNAGFAALGIDARYELRPTNVEEAETVLEELQGGLWKGVNVTTPLKTVLAPRIQTLRGHAARAGAVNTLWLDAGEIIGALTDVEGIVEPLRAAGLAAGGGLVLGAGGAARAAVLALEELGLEAHVAAREQKRAALLLDELKPRVPGLALALSDRDALEQLFGSLAVVIQATPVGRAGERHDLPGSRSPADTVAFEMVYAPSRTLFVADAEQAGCRTVLGFEMLVAQGAVSFEIWTGEAAPREVMRAAIAP